MGLNIFGGVLKTLVTILEDRRWYPHHSSTKGRMGVHNTATPLKKEKEKGSLKKGIKNLCQFPFSTPSGLLLYFFIWLKGSGFTGYVSEAISFGHLYTEVKVLSYSHSAIWYRLFYPSQY